MNNKTKVTTDAVEANPKAEPTFKQFTHGDLRMTCSHCGHTELVEKGIKDGLQFVLPTTDEHKLKLACSKCGISLQLTFDESDEDTKKEAEEKYDAWLKEQEAAKVKTEVQAEEVIQEASDALLREDTEKEPVQEDN